ncbi:hypothetical protein [Sediminibacterium ginsengisoli]|uniref:Uncharacterized protein n=1 Tax=Sediminibacterium ginsengisoli TaxID=413434 RepID=A0A1T4RHH2_9BACT|nr:hypothetical protein [Sediminibacterium ginsengisoli]SKA15357.1 hypothetical protein SAMN04488132_11279 [Sediminibacterium ginsengisoli]
MSKKAFLFVCGVGTAFFACKKNDTRVRDHTGASFQSVSAWYQQAIQQGSEPVRRNLAVIMKSLDCTRSTRFVKPDGTVCHIIPAKLKAEDPDAKKFLVLREKDQRYEAEGVYEAGSIEQLKALFTINRLNSGQAVTRWNIDGTPSMGWQTTVDGREQIKKAKSISNTAVKISDATVNRPDRRAPEEDLCIDWYWILFDIRTGEIISEVYVFSTGNCSFGNGSAFVPVSPTSCYDEQEADFHFEANNSTPLSVGIGADVMDINGITKFKNPSWKCFSGAGGGWWLVSKEIGKVKLADPLTNTWAWVSLTHGSIVMNGSAPPGTAIDYTQGTGTPSFTPEAAQNSLILYAGMELDYGITYSFLSDCSFLGTNIGKLVSPVSKQYHSSYGFWNANP